MSFLIRFTSILQKINADHFEGADEKFAVKSGGNKEFDPLRDGPLRYLGYSNECGWAISPTLSMMPCLAANCVDRHRDQSSIAPCPSHLEEKACGM